MSSETGFARIAGMAEDLHLVGLRYNIAAAILFVRTCFLVDYITDVLAGHQIPYCLVEAPSYDLLPA
jgi:hypothetical protein